MRNHLLAATAHSRIGGAGFRARPNGNSPRRR